MKQSEKIKDLINRISVQVQIKEYIMTWIFIATVNLTPDPGYFQK